MLGATKDDDAETLKKKYYQELLRRHPDEGGTHMDFLELQEASDNLADKRKEADLPYEKGQHVEAKWSNSKKWYACQVVGVNDDGTYALVYADKSWLPSVSPEQMRMPIKAAGLARPSRSRSRSWHGQQQAVKPKLRFSSSYSSRPPQVAPRANI